MMVKISPFSGKRFNDFFEKINFLLNETSKTPPPLGINAISTSGKYCFNSASKLEAFGR